jgi:hypothetical protein
VPFAVHIVQDVYEYIDRCERLTPYDRARITDDLAAELGAAADVFLKKNPHPFLPDRFWYDYTFMTEALEVRTFHFSCNAEGHVYGVTEVLYAEEQPEDNE